MELPWTPANVGDNSAWVCHTYFKAVCFKMTSLIWIFFLKLYLLFITILITDLNHLNLVIEHSPFARWCYWAKTPYLMILFGLMADHNNKTIPLDHIPPSTIISIMFLPWDIGCLIMNFRIPVYIHKGFDLHRPWFLSVDCGNDRLCGSTNPDGTLFDLGLATMFSTENACVSCLGCIIAEQCSKLQTIFTWHYKLWRMHLIN